MSASLNPNLIHSIHSRRARLTLTVVALVLAVLAGLRVGAAYAATSALPGTDLEATSVDTSIAVVRGEYDSIEAVLDSMGRSYDLLNGSELTAADLPKYKTLFINCGDDGDAGTLKTALKEWVDSGGCLYASDWAYEYVNTSFPGEIVFPVDPKIGSEQTATGSILDPGLAWYLNPLAPPSQMDINFDLGGWVVPSGVAGGTTTYVSGTVDTDSGSMPNTPLIVGFTSGKGRVIYTTFHNHAQVSDIEKKVLEYLVLMPQAGQLSASLESSIEASYPGWKRVFEGFYGLDNGETSPSFEVTPTTGKGMVIGANWEGATVGLEVRRPNGTVFNSQSIGAGQMQIGWFGIAAVSGGAGPVQVYVPGSETAANPGVWTYRLVGTSVPDPNHPVVVAVYLETIPPPVTYTITPSAGAGGSITPNVQTTVNSGASQLITITADSGYHIADVLVDGTSLGQQSYNSPYVYSGFTNVTSNHTISASFAADEVPPPTLLPVYRFLNLKYGTHFYTATESEYNDVLNNKKADFAYEGIAYQVVPKGSEGGSIPVHRFLSKKYAYVHFYTADPGEYAHVANNMTADWQYEGVGYNVWPTGTPDRAPVNRFLNLKYGVHFYTATTGEYTTALGIPVYQWEGIGFAVVPSTP